MKRQWTRGEKLLWLAPLIFVAAAGVAVWGPTLARRSVGLPRQLETSPGIVLRSLALSEDGTLLAATGTAYSSPLTPLGGVIYFWDARTLAPLPNWNRGAGILSVDTANAALALSPDAQSVAYAPFASAYSNPTFMVFDRTKQQKKWGLNGDFSMARARFSPDGTRMGFTLGVAGGGTRFLIARTSDGKVISQMPSAKTADYQARLAWAPDGKTVALLVANGRTPTNSKFDLQIRRAQDGKLVRSWPSPWLSTFGFSPGGKELLTLVAPSSNATPSSPFIMVVALVDASTGREKWRYADKSAAQNGGAPFFGFIVDARIAPDGKTVAAILSSTQRVVLLDARTGALKSTLVATQRTSTSFGLDSDLAWSPDSKRLYARGQNAVLVWDLD